MKIGIVSQYALDNVGNQLQNYALQQVLQQYGQVITLRNFPRPRSLRDRLAQSAPGRSPVFSRLLGRSRRACFLEFHGRHIRDSRGTYFLDSKDLRPEDKCDFYCAGSDQIWKPGSGRAGDFHFLPFGERENTFSYAASFGLSEIPAPYRESMAKGLAHMGHISLREESGRAILRELTGRTDAPVLPDPALLLSARQWEALAKPPKRTVESRYALLYFLGGIPRKHWRWIWDMSSERKVWLLDILAKDGCYHATGPAEFLYLVRHADIVCTDSYHGSIFAWMFRRPLVIFPRAGEGASCAGRMETLVSRLGLETCLWSPDIPASHAGTPDYRAGEAVLKRDRRRARRYLDRVLGGKIP